MTALAEIQRGAIQLGHESPFALGGMQVEPMSRQVRWERQDRILEPRVMQVLVALGREPGKIVSRDVLVERCWNGRIVGENAINRVISILRQLASDSQAFEITTITKVGYQLKARGKPIPAGSIEPLAAEESRSSTRRVLLGAVTAAILGGGTWLLAGRHGARSEARSLLQQGAEVQRRGGTGALAQAIALFEQAAETDPDFADAWAALASGRLAQMRSASDAEFSQLVPKVRNAAARALRLEPDHREAGLAFALHLPRFGHWVEVERYLGGALLRTPDEPALHSALGWLLCDLGRFPEAERAFGEAARREPLLVEHQLGRANALSAGGDPAEAENLLRLAVRQSWDDHLPWLALFLFLTFNRRPAEALAMAERGALGLAGTSPLPVDVGLLGAKALVTGATADVSIALAAVQNARTRGKIATWLAVRYFAAFDAIDEVFHHSSDYLLGRSILPGGARRPLPIYVQRRTDFLFTPTLEGARLDPRFASLVQQIRLPITAS